MFSLTSFDSHEEIKDRWKAGNACCHSGQKLLSSSLVSKNVSRLRYIDLRFLPFVLCGCETWPLTLREECRLKVFENWVLRRIFGPRRDEITGEWRRLHNEERYALYS